MKPTNRILDSWTWKMAWRDSRSSRKRLLLFVSSIVLGVAALVAISSFGASLEKAIDEQAKTLLGADLAVRSRTPLDPATEEILASVDADQSRQVSFSSMALFPGSGDLRLVQVRAMQGDFPYYGSFKTEPESAAANFQQGPNALVDDGLMRQFRARVGDEIRLGEFTFRIAGRLIDIPGEAVAVNLAAPRVFIPMQYLKQTNLIQVGSRVSYRVFFKLPPQTRAETVVSEIKPRLSGQRLDFDTVERRKRNLGRAMDNLYQFLSLVGFIALLLGAIGIASSIHLYVKQKVDTVAILRCLGCGSRQTLAIYLLQAAAMGVLGTAAGSLLGIGVQAFVPRVLGDFLPLSIPFEVSWGAVARAAAVGLGFALLFALMPLLPIRRVSPLLAIRSEFEADAPFRRDGWRIAAGGLIALAALLFALAQTDGRWSGVFFFLGLLTAFGLLAAVAKLITWGVKRVFPSSWSYVWRQGLANLYRPQNQTLVLMLSLGLGTFLIVTLHLVQGTLLSQAALTGGDGKPNLVFFDIQSDQKEGVAELIRARGAPLLQDVPIVTMRLESIKGRRVEEIRQDENRRQSRWALTREYRSTYRSELSDSERIVAGTWVARHDPASAAEAPVSLSQGIAEELNVELGDQLTFDVQGVPVATRVASLREVEWRRVQPNFFAVFPAGVLEDAPQFHVLVTRMENARDSADLQRAVVERFPNVSAIDLALILGAVDAILEKVSFVIQFMALFSVFTGLLVLAGAVVTSRYQRMREAVLLRTLGASRQQILKILVIEYLFLGSFAALTGLSLAVAAAWGLARFAFETDFTLDIFPVTGAIAVVVALTILIGVLNSRAVLDKPPLQVLRTEV